MKYSVEYIFEDLQSINTKHGINITLMICAIVIRSLMGIENWRNFVSASFSDYDFKKLIEKNKE